MTSYRREAFCGLYYSKGPISLFSGQNKTLVIDFPLLRKQTVEGNPSFWSAFLIKNLLYLSFFTFELFKSLRSVQQQHSGPGGSSCPLAQAAAAHGSGRRDEGGWQWQGALGQIGVQQLGSCLLSPYGTRALLATVRHMKIPYFDSWRGKRIRTLGDTCRAKRIVLTHAHTNHLLSYAESRNLTLANFN